MAKSKYTKELLEPIVKNSKSFRQVLEKLGLNFTGGGQSYIKHKVITLGLDISHFTGKAWNKGTTIFDNDKLGHKHTTESIFCVNSGVFRSRLRDLVKSANLLPYRCNKCQLSEWLDADIILHLDHINGTNNDNRLENLRWLCPNCHSQTETYCRKKTVK